MERSIYSVFFRKQQENASAEQHTHITSPKKRFSLKLDDEEPAKKRTKVKAIDLTATDEVNIQRSNNKSANQHKQTHSIATEEREKTKKKKKTVIVIPSPNSEQSSVQKSTASIEMDDPFINKKTKQIDLSFFIKGIKTAPKPLIPSQPDVELPYAYIKIPKPVTTSWARAIHPFTIKNDFTGSKYLELNHLQECIVEKLGGTFDGILMDPPWNEPGLVDLMIKWKSELDKLISKGLLFIWAEKEFIAQAVKVAHSWNFTYVENLVWVKYHANNELVIDSAPYFGKSKSHLLIFRKQSTEQIELRHQRNPDVVFDFQRCHADGREDKPEAVYKTIEVMLPTTHYNPDTGRGRMLELWSRKGHCRKGWTTVFIHHEDDTIHNDEFEDELFVEDSFDDEEYQDHSVPVSNKRSTEVVDLSLDD